MIATTEAAPKRNTVRLQPKDLPYGTLVRTNRALRLATHHGYVVAEDDELVVLDVETNQLGRQRVWVGRVLADADVAIGTVSINALYMSANIVDNEMMAQIVRFMLQKIAAYK